MHIHDIVQCTAVTSSVHVLKIHVYMYMYMYTVHVTGSVQCNIVLYVSDTQYMYDITGMALHTILCSCFTTYNMQCNISYRMLRLKGLNFSCSRDIAQLYMVDMHTEFG